MRVRTAFTSHVQTAVSILTIEADWECSGSEEAVLSLLPAKPEKKLSATPVYADGLAGNFWKE